LELFLSITRPSSTKHGIGVNSPYKILLIRSYESKKTQRFQSYYVITKNSKIAAHHKGNHQFKTKIFCI